ncbi:MAG: hypothetical protein LBV73_27440 [Paraburkholderia sp.]|nr:hypothetical protein [Paraburkholderia sp.]
MTEHAAAAEQTRLEAVLSRLAGHPVEITIRAERAFTISFEAIDRPAGERIASFVGGRSTSVETDGECGTFVYIEA